MAEKEYEMSPTRKRTGKGVGTGRENDGDPGGKKSMAKKSAGNGATRGKSNGSMDKRMSLGEVGNYGAVDHGRPGKLQDSHESLGGARARIHTGDPSELTNKNDGRTE